MGEVVQRGEPPFDPPEWLITFTATFPLVGEANGRLRVEYRLAHAASSISARSARLSFS